MGLKLRNDIPDGARDIVIEFRFTQPKLKATSAIDDVNSVETLNGVVTG